MKKRKLDILILSDLHLGTYGCHAEELVNYLKSVRPKVLILNGDIIDMWYFKRNYWPASHMNVVKQLMKKVASGIPVYYLTGNHDDMLRKFSDFNLGNFNLQDKLLLELDGKIAWIFHGDVFDASIRHARWIARLGGKGYEFLIFLNRMINKVLIKMGRPRMSFSKKVKNSVKRAVKFVSDFEQTAADIAIDKEYDYVICGHIHQPQMREMFHSKGNKGSVKYLNSGDWVENLTALEYYDGKWHLYQYQDQDSGEVGETENFAEEREENVRFNLFKDLENFPITSLPFHKWDSP